jgi:hypothetical protein
MIQSNGKIKAEYEHHVTPIFSGSTSLSMSIGPLAGPVFPVMLVYDAYDMKGKIPGWGLPTFAVAVCDEPEILYGKNRFVSDEDVKKGFCVCEKEQVCIAETLVR